MYLFRNTIILIFLLLSQTYSDELTGISDESSSTTESERSKQNIPGSARHWTHDIRLSHEMGHFLVFVLFLIILIIAGLAIFESKFVGQNENMQIAENERNYGAIKVVH
jgi:hypothetical protein